jgi:hypothetical protein
MGKNKNAAKGNPGAIPAAPLTTDEHRGRAEFGTDAKAQVDREVAPGPDTSAKTKTVTGIGFASFGNANPSMPNDTSHELGSLRRDLLSPTHSIQGLYFHTGDMEVMVSFISLFSHFHWAFSYAHVPYFQVAGTHVFRVHQELLAAHSDFFTEQLQVSVDSHGLVVAPRSEDIQVVVLRDIAVDAFVDVLRLVYPM